MTKSIVLNRQNIQLLLVSILPFGRTATGKSDIYAHAWHASKCRDLPMPKGYERFRVGAAGPIRTLRVMPFNKPRASSTSIHSGSGAFS
jgi:hypothetical protein